MNAEGKKSYMQVFPLLFPAQKRQRHLFISQSCPDCTSAQKIKCKKGKENMCVFFQSGTDTLFESSDVRLKHQRTVRSKRRKTQEVLKERGFQNQRKGGIKETAAL